jgi:hypothetical protein
MKKILMNNKIVIMNKTIKMILIQKYKLKENIVKKCQLNFQKKLHNNLNSFNNQNQLKIIESNQLCLKNNFLSNNNLMFPTSHKVKKKSNRLKKRKLNNKQLKH